jgi:adenylate cyclase
MTRPSDRLDSWKEIAAYLKRGARTVQRWEREESLPVHRLRHDKLGSVYAYKSELDQWWSNRGVELQPRQNPSVAVLPFADLSPEKDQQYFCDGMAEEMIDTLSRIPALRVVSRTASFHAPGGGAGFREIGKRLGVASLLEGSVRKAGSRLRIAVRLTEAETGFHLWSEQYNRELKEVFAVQDEIAKRVAEALGRTLAAAPPEGLEADEYYRRGRAYYYQYSPRSVECALHLFLRAMEIDPESAEPYAGLADCWSYLYLYSDRSEILREQAEWASGKAVEIDRRCAQAQASRGLTLSLDGHNQEAEAAFETALQIDPGLFEANYFYARHCFTLRHFTKAAELYEQSAASRPEDYQPPLLVAQVYDALGRADDARAARRKGVDLARRHLRLYPDDARAMYMSANGLVALGETERGRQAAERALDMRPDDPMLLYNVGCIFAMLGMGEAALECLTKAAAGGLTQKAWYENDGNLDSIRANPRFEELLKSLA